MALVRPSTYWRRINPAGALSDFREVYNQAGRYRWRFAALAAAVTFGLFAVMWQEEMRGPPRRPTVTLITSWRADRSDAEIIASNLAHQKWKDKVLAEQAKRDEEVRKIYKALGRASGMDVDAIERKAMAERAAEEKAKRDARAAAPALPTGETPADPPPAPAPAPPEPAPGE